MLRPAPVMRAYRHGAPLSQADIAEQLGLPAARFITGFGAPTLRLRWWAAPSQRPELAQCCPDWRRRRKSYTPPESRLA
jgi:hypothetical protein